MASTPRSEAALALRGVAGKRHHLRGLVKRRVEQSSSGACGKRKAEH